MSSFRDTPNRRDDAAASSGDKIRRLFQKRLEPCLSEHEDEARRAMDEHLAAQGQELEWYFKPCEDSFRNAQTLSDLGLGSLLAAKVLEWFAFKVWVAGEEGTPRGDYHSKSYDPLTIEMDTRGGGTAHSYVFNLGDGGRHHGFMSLEELERRLFEEAIGRVQWAYRSGREDAQEAMARYFWLEENPGQETAWDSWDDDRLEWEQRKPYYDRALVLLDREARDT